MSKIQSIICLFIFIVILFSMDIIFGNPLKESFSKVEPKFGEKIGSTLDYHPKVRTNTLNGNMVYPNKGFLAGDLPPSYIVNSDDQPLHFSFPL